MVQPLQPLPPARPLASTTGVPTYFFASAMKYGCGTGIVVNFSRGMLKNDS